MTDLVVILSKGVSMKYLLLLSLALSSPVAQAQGWLDGDGEATTLLEDLVKENWSLIEEKAKPEAWLQEDSLKCLATMSEDYGVLGTCTVHGQGDAFDIYFILNVIVENKKKVFQVLGPYLLHVD